MFFVKPGGVTLRQFGAPVRGADRRLTSPPTDSTIQATIQPIKDGSVLEVLEEGLRGKTTIWFSSTTAIRTAEQSGRRADELVVDGVVYQVQTSEHWNDVLPHYEGLAVKLDEEASP